MLVKSVVQLFKYSCFKALLVFLLIHICKTTLVDLHEDNDVAP